MPALLSGGGWQAPWLPAVGYPTSSDQSCLAERSWEWQVCFSRERLQCLIFLSWSKTVSNLWSLWDCPRHSRGRAVMKLLLQVSQTSCPMLTDPLLGVNFAQAHLYQYNTIIFTNTILWAIIVSKSDSKLLVVLISQDLEGPSPIAACSFFPPYHCFTSEICGSSYCAWNHTYLNIKKKKEGVCLVPSLVLLKLCSQGKISSLIPYAVLIKALTFLMLHFDWRGLSWLLHCPAACIL